LKLVPELQHGVALADHVVDAARQETSLELLVFGDEMRPAERGEDRSAKFVTGQWRVENLTRRDRGCAELFPLPDGRQDDELCRLMMRPCDPFQLGDVPRVGRLVENATSERAFGEQLAKFVQIRCLDRLGRLVRNDLGESRGCVGVRGENDGASAHADRRGGMVDAHTTEVPENQKEECGPGEKGSVALTAPGPRRTDREHVTERQRLPDRTRAGGVHTKS